MSNITDPEASDAMSPQQSTNFSLPRTAALPKRVSYLASKRDSMISNKRDSQLSRRGSIMGKRRSSQIDFDKRNSQLDTVDVESGKTLRELFYALDQLPSAPSINFNLPPNAINYLDNISEKDLMGEPAGQEGRPSPTMSSFNDSSQEDLEKSEPPPPNPWMDPKSFPDGGAQAWLTVAGASACLFVSFGWVNAIGVFQEYYQTHQLKQYSPSMVAWIPALQIFFMLVGGLPVGQIFDNYGPRGLIAAGTFFHVFGLMMTSISTEYYQFLLSQAVCSAIGASMVFYPAFTCVSTWFFAKRGAALGLVVAGSSLGGVIFPIMVIHLIPQVGFAWTMRICAFLILGLLGFANFALRSRLPPTKRPFKLKAFIRPLKEPVFSLLTAAVFFFYWGMFIPFTFIVVEALAHGMSLRLANYLVPILNGASIIGRTVPNALADKLGRFNVMIVMASFTTLLILALWLPATGNIPIILFAALFGISSGAGVGLTPALCAQISPLSELGVRSGTAYTISAFAALTGSPIGGEIISAAKGDFRYAIAFGGVSCAIGTVLFGVTRVLLGGWSVKTKV